MKNSKNFKEGLEINKNGDLLFCYSFSELLNKEKKRIKIDKNKIFD